MIKKKNELYSLWRKYIKYHISKRLKDKKKNNRQTLQKTCDNQQDIW